MKRTLIALAIGAAALQSPVLRAQAPQAPPSVTFQVEVNYVDVDVVVTDEKGNFVSGLTREDFEVFEDGKPQKVDTFAYVEIPVEPDNAFMLGGRTVSSDTQSNSAAVCRAFVRHRPRRSGRQPRCGPRR